MGVRGRGCRSSLELMFPENIEYKCKIYKCLEEQNIKTYVLLELSAQVKKERKDSFW